MDSLYGGHAGVSFVLKGSFESVSAMAKEFSKGASYKDIWYNEYAIIDTKNKNDADNGKIYRRGYNFQDKNGGAIYLGQIVGPSSGTPYFQVNSIDDVKKKADEELGDYEYRRYPTGKDSDGNFVTTESDGAIGEFDFEQKDYSLVPGKLGDEYNDSIKYTWVNIRKDNADADSWFYVGLQIPYHVTDYGVHAVSPYDDNGVFADTATIENKSEQNDDGSFVHPFYSLWELGVPRGVKGDALRNLRVITIDDDFVSQYGDKGNKYVYLPAALQIDDESGAASFKTVTDTNKSEITYTPTVEDAKLSRQIVVFDFYMFDEFKNPASYLIYVGDFRTIREVQVSDSGTITVTYTNGADTVFNDRIRWIDAISLTTGDGAAGGRLLFTYNNDSKGSKYEEFNISYLKNIDIADNGTVTYTYCGTNNNTITIPQDGKIVKENLIKWIDNVSLDENSGQFGIRYNTSKLSDGEFDYKVNLDFVRDITMDETTGDIVLYHTSLSNSGDVIGSDGKLIPGTETLAAKLKIINGASVSSDGIMTFTFNTGDMLTVKNTGSDIDEPHKFREIADVTLDSGISADKHIKVRYNTSSGSNSIGDPINYIDDMVVRPSDFHLLVMFSDPTKRPVKKISGDTINVDYSTSIYNNASGWVSNDDVNSFYTNPEYTGKDLYWRDYGTIKDQSGILIGLNVSYKTVKNYDGYNTGEKKDILTYLNHVYPNGLHSDTNGAINEKVVTYSPSAEEGKEDKEFYAFDYNAGVWYYLGTIADTGTRDVQLYNGSGSPSASEIKNLNSNGLLFKYYDVTCVDDSDDNPGVPEFWSASYMWE